ncbi:Protein phosphatase methylesterase 1 [Armadillidium nasatum]|uniref:protein phosphatase methylesterase-1 n=1 Tax=Armadillidium nasatum TaxID=96803 RepID=A0A5N5T742_9CRUS|nr:Protein phosphatase methylesterase 1 [Armadillidium nasatum]
MSDLQKALHKKLPPVIPVAAGAGGRRGSGSGRRRRYEYTPVSWDKYWEKCEDIEVSEGDVFRVYRKGSTGPLLCLLHGGGYSALTWSLFAESVTDMVECQVMAFDQRGHGDTCTTDDTDLSADTLAKDVGRVIEATFEDKDTHPPCVLIGHSMGGAVGVHTAYNQYITDLAGLVVIDVVEGTAMDALSSMQSFLRGRPQHFNSLQNAIEWGVRSGQTRNAEAARVSMPGQVKK